MCHQIAMPPTNHAPSSKSISPLVNLPAERESGTPSTTISVSLHPPESLPPPKETSSPSSAPKECASAKVAVNGALLLSEEEEIETEHACAAAACSSTRTRTGRRPARRRLHIRFPGIHSLHLYFVPWNITPRQKFRRKLRRTLHFFQAGS